MQDKYEIAISALDLLMGWRKWQKIHDQPPTNTDGWESYLKFLGGTGFDAGAIYLTSKGKNRLDILKGPHAATMLKVYEIKNEPESK